MHYVIIPLGPSQAGSCGKFHFIFVSMSSEVISFSYYG
jgi:hypothetical protein